MLYQCDNCGWETDNEEEFKPLGEVRHLAERLDEGCPVPAGECPECGCFVYEINKSVKFYDAKDEILASLERCAFLLGRIADGDHWAVQNSLDAATEARKLLAKIND